MISVSFVCWSFAQLITKKTLRVNAATRRKVVCIIKQLYLVCIPYQPTQPVGCSLVVVAASTPFQLLPSQPTVARAVGGEERDSKQRVHSTGFVERDFSDEKNLKIDHQR